MFERLFFTLATKQYDEADSQTLDLIWHDFFNFSELLTLNIDNALKEECDIDLPQYTILMALADSPEKRLQLGELAKRTVFSPSRLNYRLGEMEKKGWLNRLCQGADKRTRNACLSRKGMQAYEDAAKVQSRIIRDLFHDQVKADDRDTLRRIFGMLRGYLESQHE